MNRKRWGLGKLLNVALVALLSVALFACSKEEVKKEISDDVLLREVTIKSSDNPTFSKDARSHKVGIYYMITTPTGGDLEGVKLDLNIHPKSSATINNQSYSSDSRHNLSGAVKIEVTAESGRKAHYDLLVNEGEDNVDQLVYQFMNKYNIPGASVAISKDEQIVYTAGLGWAEKEMEERVKPNYLFRLASISKQFTTVAIMKLHQEGKLSIDDVVFGPGGILEDDYSDVVISNRAAQVTIKHFLEHSSGWTTSPDPMFTSSFKGQTLDQLVRYVLGSEHPHDPGTTYGYFNMGFGILGLVIEKVTGKGFEEYLKEYLAEMGIDDIHVGGDRAGRRANEVVYYSQYGYNGYGNEMDVIAAAGGVIASAPEMLKFLFHIDGLPTVPDILTSETRELMLTPGVHYDRYALGWRANHRYFPDSWYHSGSLAGTAVMWVMGPRVNAIVLLNYREHISAFDDDLWALLRDVISVGQNKNWGTAVEQ